MMKHTFALFFAFACLNVHGQAIDTTTVIANAPCVNILADSAQNDVVVRLVLPPLEELDAETETVQLTNSTGDILPYFKGQVWADSSEVWVRFDSLPVDESIFFLSTSGYSHPNDPLQVFDLYDSFDLSSLNEDIWTASVQSGASFDVGNGELSMNVTQTDNYCSIYSNQIFDLDQNWAILLQARTQDNRGHVCMAIGSGYDAGRLANGGYSQLNGYGIGESHDKNWAAHLKVDGIGFETPKVGEDLTYAPMIASWADQSYRLLISGSLASTTEVGMGEKPSGAYPFFLWLNAWDGNNRTLWLDYVAIYVAAEAFIQVGESGCLEPNACNYNPLACISDESCDYSCCPGPGCCGVGTTWNWETSECDVANPADINLDGCVQLNDLLDLLSAYGDCGAEESAWQCGDPLEYQGYNYETVQIGEQCWFAENLRAENYQDGAPIASEAFSAAALEFGLLYRGSVVADGQSVCPTNWSVSSDNDWLELEMFLGAQSSEALTFAYSNERLLDQGDALKLASENSVGFNATFGGYLNGAEATEVTGLGMNGQWWTGTASEENTSLLIYRNVENSTSGISRIYQPVSAYGFSIRCIKDAE